MHHPLWKTVSLLLVATALAVWACGQEPVKLSSGASAPAFEGRWSVALGGVGSDTVDGLVTDRTGDITVIGTYVGSMKAGDVELQTAVDGDRDIFLVRYQSGGHLIWAKSFGGEGAERVRAAVSDKNGVIYLTGSYSEVISFGELTKKSTGGTDAFVVAVNSQGEVLWLTSLGGSGLDSGEKVVALPDGTLAVAGHFSDTISIGGENFTSMGSTDVFIARISAVDGAVIAGVSAGGEDSETLTGLVADGDGNPVVGGTFRGKATIGDSSPEAIGEVDGYLWRSDGLQ